MKRQPSGTPSGGRFAHAVRAEGGDLAPHLDPSAGTFGRLLADERAAVRRIASAIAVHYPNARFLLVNPRLMMAMTIHNAEMESLGIDMVADWMSDDYESLDNVAPSATSNQALNRQIDEELRLLEPEGIAEGWRAFVPIDSDPEFDGYVLVDLRNARAGVGGDGRIVDFPTDVASATALMDAIPAECFLSGHEGGIRGCREARLDFERFARWGDDTGAAVSAMEAWTSYRTRSGHRDDALDQMAEFRRFLR